MLLAFDRGRRTPHDQRLAAALRATLATAPGVVLRQQAFGDITPPGPFRPWDRFLDAGYTADQRTITRNTASQLGRLVWAEVSTVTSNACGESRYGALPLLSSASDPRAGSATYRAMDGVSTSLTIVEAMGYAYRLTGDTKFMDAGIACLRRPEGVRAGARASPATFGPPHFMSDVREFSGICST